MLEAWWNDLTTALRIFYGIGFVTSFLLGVQLLLLMLGLDHHDGDIDSFDGDHGSGGNILSVRSVTAFFAGFGWTGVVAVKAGFSLFVSLLLATLVGGALMAGVFLLMRGLYSLRHSGTLDYQNAVGSLGSVYLRVPPNLAGPGQVEVMIQGRLHVVEAFTRSPEVLPNQSRIKVIGLMDQSTLLVEPVGAHQQTPAEG